MIDISISYYRHLKEISKIHFIKTISLYFKKNITMFVPAGKNDYYKNQRAFIHIKIKWHGKFRYFIYIFILFYYLYLFLNVIL